MQSLAFFTVNYSGWDWNLFNSIRRLSLITLLLFLPPAAFGQQGSQSATPTNWDGAWNGVWTAEGTLFRIGVEVENGEMKVTQIESLGFAWTNTDGKIEGNVVKVEVEYAGVTGTIQAELIDANTAVVFAATCLPEFMVVCALAKNRQAIFRKVEAKSLSD